MCSFEEKEGAECEENDWSRGATGFSENKPKYQIYVEKYIDVKL